jgi:hypothetical protein
MPPWIWLRVMGVLNDAAGRSGFIQFTISLKLYHIDLYNSLHQKQFQI